MMSMTKCPSDCVDGCHCPPDMYFDKEYERCVKREQCSCYWDGVHYAHLSLRRGDVEDWYVIVFINLFGYFCLFSHVYSVWVAL